MTSQYNLAPNPRWQEWQSFVVEASPLSYDFTANATTNIITTEEAPNYFTGKDVLLNTTSALPAPLASGVIYYIIFVTSTSFKLAATYNDAINGTAIDLTNTGTGTHTIISAGQGVLIPLANGKMYTKSSINPTQDKATYLDNTGTTQNTNPIIFNNYGQATIYWKVNLDNPNDNYYIEVYNAADVLIYAVGPFNAPSTNQNSALEAPVQNMARNGAFTYWNLYNFNDIDVGGNFSSETSVEVATEWFFEKNNTNATDLISRQTFTAGQTEVPNNPVYYMLWSCTNSGAGAESYKRIFQEFSNVQTFSGQSIAMQFNAKTNAGQEELGISVIQDFGGGGSSAVTTSASSIVLNDSWQPYSVVINVPSVSGKVIGTNSKTKICFDLPLNETGTIAFSNVQFSISEAQVPFIQQTLEEQKNTLTINGETGDIIIHPNINTIPRQWIQLSDGTIGRNSSNATLRESEDTKSLFLFLWTTYSDNICPVYDDTGAKVVRGASALADFNANRQLQLFWNSSRTIANIGTPHLQLTFTADASTDELTIPSVGSFSFYLGKPVTFLTTGTLPAPLALATTYYMVPQTATTYKLATSAANAFSGSIINITDAGTGIHTIVLNQGDNRSAGEASGESYHAQQVAELAGHYHTYERLDPLSGTPLFVDSTGGNQKYYQVTDTSTVGTNSPSNVIQPTLWLPYIIKL